MLLIVIPAFLSCSTGRHIRIPNRVNVGAAGCDFSTLQEALDSPAVGVGDIIRIRDRIHTESGIIISKNVTIEGRGGTKTILQAHEEYGEAEERVFLVQPWAIVTIRRLTIRHGSPVVCPKSGGGIHNRGELTIANCRITKNAASTGGGIANSGTLSIINSLISFNTADGRGGDKTRGSGGGIKSGSGKVTIIRSTIENNTTVFRGGGIKLCCGSILNLTDSLIKNNKAVRNGGGIHIKGLVNISGSTITGNEASDAAGIMNDGELSIENSVITGNRTRLEWGAADLLTGDEGILAANVNNSIEHWR